MQPLKYFQVDKNDCIEINFRVCYEYELIINFYFDHQKYHVELLIYFKFLCVFLMEMKDAANRRLESVESVLAQQVNHNHNLDQQILLSNQRIEILESCNHRMIKEQEMKSNEASIEIKAPRKQLKFLV